MEANDLINFSKKNLGLSIYKFKDSIRCIDTVVDKKSDTIGKKCRGYGVDSSKANLTINGISFSYLIFVVDSLSKLNYVLFNKTYFNSTTTENKKQFKKDFAILKNHLRIIAKPNGLKKSSTHYSKSVITKWRVDDLEIELNTDEVTHEKTRYVMTVGIGKLQK
jgi:hypothetical protein